MHIHLSYIQFCMHLFPFIGVLLLAANAFSSDVYGVSGVVHGPQNTLVAEASVSLFTAHQVSLGSTATDDQGRFQFNRVPQGSYLLRVNARGFAEQRRLVDVPQAEATRLEVTLSLQPVLEQITVAADPGQV